MEFEDVWLEVRSCSSGSTTEITDSMLEVPAISEAIEAAANANKHPGMWDYSRRIGTEELEAICRIIKLAKTAEDGISVSYSTNVAYRGSRYTLTLFAVKRSQ